MPPASDTTVRKSAGEYLVERADRDPPLLARIRSKTDRADAIVGWTLKTDICLSGPASRVWDSPIDALVGRKLMTKAEARRVIAIADATD